MSKLADKLIERMNSKNVSKLGDKNAFTDKTVFASTGSPELEANLGSFGFIKGLTEIAGASKSGKTTLMLTAMASHQKRYPEGIRIILSSEERDNKLYAANIGVDVDEVIIIKSIFLENLFYELQNHIDEISELWVEEKLPGRPKIFVGWDSVGSTNSRAELETFKENSLAHKKAMEKGQSSGAIKFSKIADFAKTARSCMKAILAQLYSSEIIFIMLNHTYDVMGSTTGAQKSTGGSWIEYLPHTRLFCTRIGWESIDDEQVGQYTKIRIEKNDHGSRRSTTIELLLGMGIVLSKEDIEYAIDKGILKKEGAKKISFMGDKLKWVSKREFYANYKNKNKFLPILYAQITKARHNDVLAEKGLL